MEFSRQEYWSGLPFPSPEDLPDPGIEPRSPALQADTLLSELPEKPHNMLQIQLNQHNPTQPKSNQVNGKELNSDQWIALVSSPQLLAIQLTNKVGERA